jgi:hypothetical protein
MKSGGRSGALGSAVTLALERVDVWINTVPEKFRLLRARILPDLRFGEALEKGEGVPDEICRPPRPPSLGKRRDAGLVTVE